MDNTLINHLSQPNKELYLKLDFMMKREMNDGVLELPWTYDYISKLEPIVSSSGQKLWRSVKPVTEDDFINEQYFYKWVHSKVNQRQITDWETIEIFKEDIYHICIDKISNNEDKENFMEILRKARNEGKLDIQRAKAFPIEEVFRMFGLDTRYGTVSCPFHDDSSPSLSANKKTNRWRCFGCNESGDTIDFVMKITNLPFREAVRRLS